MSSTLSESAANERRGVPDRRQKHVLYSDWRYALGGRRRTGRRSASDLEAGVDWYDSRLLYMAIAILLMSAMDATFTLMLMQAGIVEEWNPFMRSLMENDVQLFANVKIALTVFALIFLVVCYHGRVGRMRLPISWIFKATLFGYSALICYELVLLSLT